MALPRNHGTTDASRWGILSGGSRPRGGGSSKGALQVVSSTQSSKHESPEANGPPQGEAVKTAQGGGCGHAGGWHLQ